MGRFTTHLRALLTAFAAALLLAGQVFAASDPLDNLYAELADPDNPEWQRAQADILREWSKSGSASMDLLLKRGREAMEAGDLTAAIEHLTALTGLGMILEELGRDAAAMEVYRASLAIHPHQDNIKQALERLERKTSGTAL